MRQRFAIRAIVVLVVLVAVAAMSRAALADGGVLQIDQRLDGHEILVYTSRGPFTEGISIDVSVLVETYPAGQLVPAAGVTVMAHEQGHGGTVKSFPATHDAAVNKAYYAAGLHLPAGRWQIVTEVKGGNWTGQAAFPLTVVPAAGTHTTATVSTETVTRFASGLVILWLIWFVFRARRTLVGQERIP